MRGNVRDAPRPGRPTKRTPEVQQRLEAAVEANPWAYLREITDTLQDLKISHMTVNKITKDLEFKLKMPWKMPFLDGFTKI